MLYVYSEMQIGGESQGDIAPRMGDAYVLMGELQKRRAVFVVSQSLLRGAVSG